jgi:hypothetical protein
MNKFKFYFILLITSITLFSCNKDDDEKAPPVPPRDRAEQYAKDNDSIERFLRTHYLTVATVNGQPDITFTKIPAGGTQTSIWDNTEYPLQSKIVKNDDRNTNLTDGRVEDPVDYTLYYLLLNQGGGQRPTTVDSTYTSYKGMTLDNNVFDSNDNPLWFVFPRLTINDAAVISGYRQFLPLLKTAASVVVDPVTGETQFTDMGVGVVFIPSGLGYFQSAQTNIPSYSPLIFRIRLHTLRSRDHDGDGVPSNNEDLNSNGDPYDDDTDNDKIPNFLDVDDDGDTYFTRFEIRVAGVITLPYPTCPGGSTPKYLDNTCH